MKLEDLLELDSPDFKKDAVLPIKSELRRRKKKENREDNKKTLDVCADGSNEHNSTRAGSGGVE